LTKWSKPLRKREQLIWACQGSELSQGASRLQTIWNHQVV
jgi:hypothetical protein